MALWGYPFSVASEILIRPFGNFIIGFHDEEDWFEYRLEHNKRFLRGIVKARKGMAKGGMGGLIYCRE
jgi:hypothetical protein